MIRRQRRKGRSRSFASSEGVFPGSHQIARNRSLVWQLLDTDNRLERWQAGNELGKILLARKHFAAVAVAVHDDQSRRFDLAKAVKNRADAEIR